MQTSPCGHRVVCRRCFVKTIQSAVAQRLLPLRCVICRARINRLISGSGAWRLQESASNYSVGTSKSWAVGVLLNITHLTRYLSKITSTWLLCHFGDNEQFSICQFQAPSTSKSAGVRVAQSASLYSMSSGSSGKTNMIVFIKCQLKWHIWLTLLSHLIFIGISYTSSRSHSSEASLSTNESGTSGTSSVSLPSRSRTDIHNHQLHDNCGSHCRGAIPRNPQYSQYQKTQPTHQQIQYHSTSSQPKSNQYTGERTANYCTPRSASYSIFRNDKQNRLPPIKEFRSPIKASISSPSRIASAPRLRYKQSTFRIHFIKIKKKMFSFIGK